MTVNSYCQYAYNYEGSYLNTSSFSTSTSTTASGNALRHGVLDRAEHNGSFPLHVIQSRARCRTPPVQPLVTCPGERGVASRAVVDTLSSEPSDITKSSMTQHQRMDGWPECFQDLRSWCPPDQDELNTPQITLQDEFNFSLEGQVNNCGNWGNTQSPAELNDSWVNQELLFPSPNSNVLIIEEENNNYSADLQSSFSLPYIKTNMSDTKEEYSGMEVEVGAPSSSVLKTKGNVLLSQATLALDESPAPVEVATPFVDFIKLNSSQLVRLGNGGKLMRRERTEENAAVAEEARRKNLTKHRPRLTPLAMPPAPTSAPTTLTTPEVLKPLTDIPMSQFNLLKYVCEGQEFAAKSESIHERKEGVASAQDHDYTDSMGTSSDQIIIKCEPLSPSGALRSMIGAKRPYPHDEEEFDSDPSELLDEDDSDSEEWSPNGKPGRRTSTSSRGKRRGRKPSSVDSSDGTDKYRALRDRNNEASRRSRQNRKQRDMEMRRHKNDLEKRNVELKVKADRMEALVKEMRAALLKSIKNSRSNSS